MVGPGTLIRVPGALAQQGERYNGIVEVVGSNPTCSILLSTSR